MQELLQIGLPYSYYNMFTDRKHILLVLKKHKFWRPRYG